MFFCWNNFCYRSVLQVGGINKTPWVVVIVSVINNGIFMIYGNMEKNGKNDGDDEDYSGFRMFLKDGSYLMIVYTCFVWGYRNCCLM